MTRRIGARRSRNNGDASKNGNGASPRHPPTSDDALPDHERSGHSGTLLERIAESMMRWTGGSAAFLLAFGLIAAWLISGPFFHFSDTWQLVINTTTTIVTFLMVFLIQRAQNKESRALELKLNELIAAVHGASSRLIDVESLSEQELDTLRRHYRTMAQIAMREGSLVESHSIEEAGNRHAKKRSRSN